MYLWNSFLVYLPLVPFSLCSIRLCTSCYTLLYIILSHSSWYIAQIFSNYHFKSQHIKRQYSYLVFPWYSDSLWRFHFTAHCNIFLFPFTSVNTGSLIYLYQFSILSCKFCGNFLPNDGLEVINPSHFLAQLSLHLIKSGMDLKKEISVMKGVSPVGYAISQ